MPENIKVIPSGTKGRDKERHRHRKRKAAGYGEDNLQTGLRLSKEPGSIK
jgi:hypothetical protein